MTSFLNSFYLMHYLPTRCSISLRLNVMLHIVGEEADKEADEDEEDKDGLDVCGCNLCVIFG